MQHFLFGTHNMYLMYLWPCIAIDGSENIKKSEKKDLLYHKKSKTRSKWSFNFLVC